MRSSLELNAGSASAHIARSRDPACLRLLSFEPLSKAMQTTLEDPTETALFALLVGLAVKALGARTVLDVGCGCGLPTLAAARAGATRVVGIDIIARNVRLTRANIQRARLQHRVSAIHGSWDAVRSGCIDVGPMDLVVANPPYVPAGEGVAVDGGPSGTRVIEAIIEGFPAGAQGLALLFGSLCDPLSVLERLAQQGLKVCEVLVQSVPFGRYTSRPHTLAQLESLRAAGRAWFCDTSTSSGLAPHAYVTLGVIATRSSPLELHDAAHEALADLLSRYQQRGPRVVTEGPSLLPLG